MTEPWAAAAGFAVVAFVMSVAMLVGARILRVRARATSRLRTTTYECGEDPEGPAWVRFHPRYYVVALVFVLFDVEAVFLFPWAMSLRGLGLLALVDMLAFVAILMLGWLYALRKEALKWQ